jgi:hypothetical protein
VRFECADLAGRALSRRLALDAARVVEVANRRRSVTIRADPARAAREGRRVAEAALTIVVGATRHAGAAFRLAVQSGRRAVRIGRADHRSVGPQPRCRRAPARARVGPGPRVFGRTVFGCISG